MAMSKQSHCAAPLDRSMLVRLVVWVESGDGPMAWTLVQRQFPTVHAGTTKKEGNGIACSDMALHEDCKRQARALTSQSIVTERKALIGRHECASGEGVENLSRLNTLEQTRTRARGHHRSKSKGKRASAFPAERPPLGALLALNTVGTGASETDEHLSTWKLWSFNVTPSDKGSRLKAPYFRPCHSLSLLGGVRQSNKSFLSPGTIPVS